MEWSSVSAGWLAGCPRGTQWSANDVSWCTGTRDNTDKSASLSFHIFLFWCQDWVCSVQQMKVSGWSAMQTVCVRWGAICSRWGEGGWKQNRTALTTEPNDEEKSCKIEKKKAAWGFGAAIWRLTGKKSCLWQRFCEGNTSLTQAFLLSLPLERTS